MWGVGGVCKCSWLLGVVEWGGDGGGWLGEGVGRRGLLVGGGGGGGDGGGEGVGGEGGGEGREGREGHWEGYHLFLRLITSLQTGRNTNRSTFRIHKEAFEVEA